MKKNFYGFASKQQAVAAFGGLLSGLTTTLEKITVASRGKKCTGRIDSSGEFMYEDGTADSGVEKTKVTVETSSARISWIE